jgi:hypothetical protein
MSHDQHDDDDPRRGPNPGGLVRETFQVSVAGGGGLEPFQAALARKFADLARRGCHCVIIERTFVENRYVQAIITPVGARLESVGDFYLAPHDDALEPTDEQRLRELGWIEPGDPDDQDDDTDPALNWWREITGPGFPADAAALLLTTFVEVHDLIDVEPVSVSVFPAEHQHFEWIDDPDHPCGGHLASTD